MCATSDGVSSVQLSFAATARSTFVDAFRLIARKRRKRTGCGVVGGTTPFGKIVVFALVSFAICGLGMSSEWGIKSQ